MARYGVLELYKWSVDTPTTFPSGTSVYTWATGQFTDPTITNGWATTPGPAFAGQTLWSVKTILTDNTSTLTSTATWSSSVASSICSCGGFGDGIIGVYDTRKDAFNEIREFDVTPGKYKFRIRRNTPDLSETSPGDETYAFFVNDTVFIPTAITPDYSKTISNFFVYQGQKTLTFVNRFVLNPGEWRLVSVVNTGVTRPDPIYPWVGGFPAITAMDSAVQTATTVITVEAKLDDGSTVTRTATQTIIKKSYLNATWDFWHVSNDRIGIPSDGSVVQDNVWHNGVQWWEKYYSVVSAPISGTFTDPYPNDTIEHVTNSVIQLAYDANVKYYILRIYDGPVVGNTRPNLVLQRKVPVPWTLATAGDKNKKYFKTLLYSITGYTTDNSYFAPIVNGAPAKIARTALRLQSSSKVNGQIDGINGIVTSICRDYDSATGNWIVRPTNNPASLFLYVLTHPANARRIKDSDVLSRIDLTGLSTWHTYCVNNGFTFNSALENISSVLDVLKDIAAAGRASPTLIDGKWGVVVDKSGKDIIQHFTPYNSWGFEAVKAIPRIPDAIRCTIRDEYNNYLPSEIVVTNTGFTPQTAELFEEFNLPGITNRAAAIKHIRWHLAQIRSRTERYTINTDMEYLVCNRGDRVKVVHDVPMWGVGSCRIKQVVSTGHIILDDAIPLQANTNYVIRIRLNSGTTPYIVRNITPVQVADNYKDLYFDSNNLLSNLVEAGNLILVGTTDSNINDCMVLSIEPMDNKNARIVLVDYAEPIFTEDLTTTYPNVYVNNLTNTPVAQQNIINTYPEVVSLVSDTTVVTNISPTLSKYNILVNIIHTGIPNNVDQIEAQYALSSSELTFGKLKSFGLQEPILLDDVQVGSEYNVRLRYKSNDGRVGPWSLSSVTSLRYFTHTVVGVEAFNDIPGTLSVDLDHTNLLLTITRLSTAPADFSHYEIRVLKDPNSIISEDFWTYADDPTNAFYNDIIKVQSVDTTVTINLLDFSLPRFDPDGIMYRIACRSVNTNGVTSKQSVLYPFLLSPLS